MPLFFKKLKEPTIIELETGHVAIITTPDELEQIESGLSDAENFTGVPYIKDFQNETTIIKN